MKNQSIVLIGMAGVGKSTMGMALSRSLGFDFIDLDDYIEQKDGRKLQEIIDAEGEQSFLQLEKRSMRQLDLDRKVVAPGGSIIYHPDLMEYLRQRATVVHLDDSLENIEARLRSANTRGIVGLRSKSLRQIYEERSPLYSRYAHFTLDCRGKSLAEVARELLNRLELREQAL
ncbi:MAG: shikimate kinase [Chloroflexi bacterium]|nr:shikimate kinase [Chloroflexota bacterium]